MTIVWDETPCANVDHLAEHGVAPDEFEQVLAERFHAREISKSNPRNWLCAGMTHARRRLIIVFEYIEDEHLVYPVTAYEPTLRFKE